MPDEQQREIGDLAQRVASLVVTDGIERETRKLLTGLMLALKEDILRGTMESLLLYRSRLLHNRDRDWTRIMAAIWFSNEEQEPELPTNPHELQAAILGWQSARERQLKAEGYNAGLRAGFESAIEQGVKYGWGGHEMGKPMDVVLKGSKSIKPNF